MKAMKAWVLGDPGQLSLVDKPVPTPGVAEVLVRIDAVAICATDLEVIAHGPPAVIGGEPPFNRNFTPGHEYMGTIVGLGPTVDEFVIGDRVAVEIHAGCGRCERCRQGMYTSCLNYGRNYGEFNKGHRANGFTTDGGFAQYAVNHVNTVVRVPQHLSDEVATLIVTAGTATYGLDVLGGLVAGESLVPDRTHQCDLVAENLVHRLCRHAGVCCDPRNRGSRESLAHEQVRRRPDDRGPPPLCGFLTSRRVISTRALDFRRHGVEDNI